MDILHLVDRLEDLLNEGWRIPLTSNVVIQEDAFLEIIDQMRGSMPEEVKKARRIEAERDRLLAQAQEEADLIVSAARDEAENLADEHELVRMAEQRAGDIIARAEREASGVLGDADDYVIDVLGSLEEQLMVVLTTVRNGLRQVQESQAERVASAQPPEVGDESTEPE